MSLTAIQSAGDAIDITRQYLFGRTLRQAVILAFMVIFLGPTGVSGPPGPIELDDEAFAGENDVPSPAELIAAIDWELAIGAIAVIGLFAVLYGLVSAFMEFGFVHSLVADTAAIREPAQHHWSRAVALFMFRAVVWGTIAVGIAVLLADALGILELPVRTDWVTLTPIAVLVGGGLYLLNRFTTDFVVPIMYHERRGLLSSWLRLVGVMRTEWRQFAVYVPVRIILEVALGIGFGLVIGLLLVAVGIVVGVPVGVVLVLALGPTVGIVLTIAVLVLVAIPLAAAALVPFHTYLRYYTLLVLGDTAEGLDLIPDKRLTARR